MRQDVVLQYYDILGRNVDFSSCVLVSGMINTLNQEFEYFHEYTNDYYRPYCQMDIVNGNRVLSK